MDLFLWMQKTPKEDLENTQIINTYMHINSSSPLKFVQLPNLYLQQRGEAEVNCGQIRKGKKKRQKVKQESEKSDERSG